MKNNITELVFILDRSGSMSGLEQDTIGGFNSLIEKQRRQNGKCYVSTVLFDHETEVLHDRVELSEISKTIIRFVAQLHSLTLSAVQFITLATFISMQEKKMFPNTPCL